MEKLEGDVHLVVGTVIEKPWAYYDDDSDELKGYAIDLTERIAEVLGFTYDITLPSDGSGTHGYKLANGSWTGMIGDLVSGKVDVVISEIAVTMERQRVIDYVVPYFEQSKLGIITMRVTTPSRLFKFIEVLSMDVWFGIFGTIIVTALLMFFVEKYSPFSGNKADPDVEPKPRIFTLKESFWFTISSITPEGEFRLTSA